MKTASRAIERALLRRQALNCLCTAGVIFTLHLEGAGAQLIFLGILGYVNALSSTAKRLNQLQRSTRVNTNYFNAINNLTTNVAVFSLIGFACILALLHWAGVIAAVTFIPIMMPMLGLLSLMFALFLCTMQLPRIMQQQTVVAIFGH